MIRTNITGIGDPFILREGDTYYMYATNSEKGFKVYTSSDLENWKDEGHVYENSAWGENCFWAPEVYKLGEGRYALLYTARWSKNHSLRTGLAFGPSPLGPFKDRTDGPLFDLGFATIDATFLFDGGKNYIFYVRDCSENVINGVHTSIIYAAEMDENLEKFVTEPIIISRPDTAWETEHDPEWQWNEGPAVIKLNGRYYLNYSSNCYASLHYSVCCSEATSPLGPYVKYDNNPILKYRENDFSGPGHNAFFTDVNGRLMTAFHIHTYYDKPSGNRRACFAPVAFDKEGKMIIEVDG